MLSRVQTASNTFDVAVCLWSAFYELLTSAEQLVAVREITRILQLGGWALVEGPPYVPATPDDLQGGKRYGPEDRIAADVIEGLSNPHYRYDAATLVYLMQVGGIREYRVSIEPWAGRPRQLLYFEKSVSRRGTT